MMLTKKNRKPTIRVSNNVLLLLLVVVFCTPQYYFSSSSYHHVVVSCLELSSLYSKARYIRTIYGHDAAQPFYKEILEINKNDDDVTAACHIAGHIDSIERHCQIGKKGTTNEKLSFINLLRDANYHPDAIADLIFHQRNNAQQQQQQQQQKSKAQKSSAPLYIQPLRAGESSSSPPPPLPSCPLGVCIQLFLMAVCLPIGICKQYLGDDIIDLFETLGVAYRDNNLVVPYIHIMPVNLNTNDNNNNSKKTIYLATDLHPNVLSTTTINDDGAVMYIGPDSLALVDHWITRRYTQQKPITSTGKNNKIVDICTGSGIQAICLSAMMMMMSNEVSSNGSASNDEDIRNSNNKDIDVICIDINSRALQFTELNFEWNGLPKPTLIQGDILVDEDNNNNNHRNKWESILQDSNIIVANPPFLPVPVLDDEISKRYGLFSSGGESGEIVLKRIVELASKTLTSSKGGGMLAIVSEFMNPQTNLSIRLQRWWEEGAKASTTSPGGGEITTATTTADAAEGILFTNEIPIDADTYAERRADSIDEKQRWIHHLAREGITHISPGLLFIKKKDRKKKTSDIGLLTLSSYLVPHSDQGSIWTPTNDVARTYTNSVLEKRSFY